MGLCRQVWWKKTTHRRCPCSALWQVMPPCSSSSQKKIERIQCKCYFVCKIVRHIRNFCSWKGHKTSFKLKAVEGVEIMVCLVWVIGIPVPSSMTTSSLPLNSEWIAKFCKSEIMWCEAPESTIQLHDECSLVVLKFSWGSVYDYWRK